MKKIPSFLIVLVLVTALCGTGTGLHAQTNTNSFVVPLATNTVLVPAVPAVTASSVTVDFVVIDNVHQKATLILHGLPPKTIQGAQFATLKAAVGPTFTTAIANLIQAGQ